ncbi:MAG TPA: four-carbon acid sugar kinase family protein [Bryobacteraceae bacterium]|nr:four-carbon acid sugar kinase family protein [Bryobacteraceae bacterium]
MSLLFSYYGDDFTGSTDALEALAANGVRTVLFPGPPDERRLGQFAGYAAVGIAGESRSRGPEWMKRVLPGVFERLRSLGAPVTQYKVCSTFDSSPEVGNIGVAMRIGREVFGSRCVPVAVAAPHLRRYVLFGNLFAAGGEAIYRIDRHPTMCRHPVTPMRESDLRLHLREQADDSFELLDIRALTGSNPMAALDDALSGDPAAIIFDGLDERSELETGRLVWASRAEFPFAVGSSGLTMALMRRWREAGLIPQQFSPAEAEAADRLIVISGSCSPVTEEQIQRALQNGFEGFHTADVNRDELLRAGLESLSRGRNVAIYSALGPNDRRGSLQGEELGRYLGNLLRELVVRSGVRRAVIAGGDTSSHAASQLGIHALTFAASMAPGAPLCRAHSDDSRMDGLELVLKGGQVGRSDFFEQVLKGHR